MKEAGEIVGLAIGRGWRPLAGVIGFACLLRGLEIVSHPAALCVAGVSLLVVACWPLMRRRRIA